MKLNEINAYIFIGERYQVSCNIALIGSKPKK
jgi:hypothetical protein